MTDPTSDLGPIEPVLRAQALQAAVDALNNNHDWTGDVNPRQWATMPARIALEAAWGFLSSAASLWALDHMRETLLDERTQLKFKVRDLEAEVQVLQKRLSQREAEVQAHIKRADHLEAENDRLRHWSKVREEAEGAKEAEGA